MPASRSIRSILRRIRRLTTARKPRSPMRKPISRRRARSPSVTCHLLKQNAIAPQDYDDVLAAWKQAQANVLQQPGQSRKRTHQSRLHQHHRADHGPHRPFACHGRCARDRQSDQAARHHPHARSHPRGYQPIDVGTPGAEKSVGGGPPDGGTPATRAWFR